MYHHLKSPKNRNASLMKTTELKTCYMCDKPATSREHAPPRGIFPERKDSLNGEDLRVSLIVVPSCDEHNCEKSRDDEYLMQVLPMSLGLNDVADNQVNTKVQRSIRRHPHMLKAMAEDAKPVLIHDTEADTWFYAPALSIDLERVKSVLEMNARAIFFHHRGVKYHGGIRVYTNFSLNRVSPTHNDSIAQLFSYTDQLLEGLEEHGENPKVFFYRIDREADQEIIEFTFYGTSKAIVILSHNTQH